MYMTPRQQVTLGKMKELAHTSGQFAVELMCFSGPIGDDEKEKLSEVRRHLRDISYKLATL